MAKIITNNEFKKEVMESSVPVLVDFYADWCGPCKMMAPVMETLSEEMAGKVSICKVNVDNDSELASKYKVMSIPTLIIFNNGEVVDKVIGAVPKDALKEKLQRVV